MTNTANTKDYIIINKKALKHHTKIFSSTFICIIIIAIVSYMGILIHEFVEYPEMYVSHFRHDLLISLESGDEEKIEEYRIRFIENDKYFFDGDLTFKMMCERYNLDYEHTKYMYEQSDYETIQKFFDNVINGNY